MNDVSQIYYQAAGGVVIHEGRILVLERPGRGELRLPKGHIEPGEEPGETARRETGEESGYAGVEIVADLGMQRHTFYNAYRKAVVTRDNHFYLMRLSDAAHQPGEAQFKTVWMTPEEAEAALTYEEEREFVRRAVRALASPGAHSQDV